MMIRGEWQIDGDGISGWAESEESGEPVWVELMINDISMGIAYANLEAEAGGGFYLSLPAVALEEEADIKVRGANTQDYLVKRGSGARGESPLLGEIGVDRGLTITGWAVDSAHSDEKLKIIAFVDEKPVAATVACLRHYRPLVSDGHGFRIELPHEFADGNEHTVRLQDEKGRVLDGKPVIVRSLPKKASDWFGELKKPDKQVLNLAAGVLESAEMRMPGIISQGRYEDWKRAFPFEQPSQRQKTGIAFLGAVDKSLLKAQQGIDIRLNEKAPEYYLSQGNAKASSPYLLAHLASEMRRSHAALVYADGESPEPMFKPAWDRETFFAQDYLGPFLVSAEVVKAAQLDSGDDEATKRVKIALAAERLGRIAHIPVPLSGHECDSSSERQKAVGAWLERNMSGASWQEGRVKYECAEKPRISIIIPTRDRADLLDTCLKSLEQTDWPDYEILIVDNGSVEADARTLLEKAAAQPNICVLSRPGVFNYSRLNNDAVRQASGEYVCFLNNDTEALHPEWLSELAAILMQAGAEGGCAGAKLLWPNGLVQHGGVIVGVSQLAAHVGNQWLDDEAGYMNRNQFAQQYSAVTAACLLTSRKLFLDEGGFDERRFPIAFNDVDYCLRLGKRGKKIFWTPHSRLMHHESASRGGDLTASQKKGSEREMGLFRKLWSHYDDRFYNPNLPLSPVCEPFSGLAFPPRARLAR